VIVDIVAQQETIGNRIVGVRVPQVSRIVGYSPLENEIYRDLKISLFGQAVGSGSYPHRLKDKLILKRLLAGKIELCP
jgi:hypothetical protein